MVNVLDQFQDDYQIEVQELNLIDHPEVMDEYEIWGTLTLIINGELAFVGQVNEQQLRDKLAAAATRDRA